MLFRHTIILLNTCSDALARQARHGDVHVLFGDYLAEINLARLALDPHPGYEKQFLDQFTDAVDVLFQNQNQRLKVSTVI